MYGYGGGENLTWLGRGRKSDMVREGEKPRKALPTRTTLTDAHSSVHTKTSFLYWRWNINTVLLQHREPHNILILSLHYYCHKNGHTFLTIKPAIVLAFGQKHLAFTEPFPVNRLKRVQIQVWRNKPDEEYKEHAQWNVQSVCRCMSGETPKNV